MEELISQFKELFEQDFQDLSKEEQIEFYQKSIEDLDKIMVSKNIDLDIYEQLLEIKKMMLSKIYILKE